MKGSQTSGQHMGTPWNKKKHPSWIPYAGWENAQSVQSYNLGNGWLLWRSLNTWQLCFVFGHYRSPTLPFVLFTFLLILLLLYRDSSPQNINSTSFIQPQIVPNLNKLLCSVENTKLCFEECGELNSSGAPLASIVGFFLYYGRQ